MTKTLNQILFSSSTEIKIFFQQHWESEYFFRKQTITRPPFKLNGRSLNANQLNFNYHQQSVWMYLFTCVDACKIYNYQ